MKMKINRLLLRNLETTVMAGAAAGGVRRLLRKEVWHRQRLQLCVLVFALLCVMAVPSTVRANSLNTTVTNVLIEIFQGPVSVQNTRLHGLGTLCVEGIKVYDPIYNDRLMLSIERVDLNYSLLGLFLNMNNIGRAVTGLKIVEPVMWVTREERGWNVSRLVQRKSDKPSGQMPKEFKVSVTDGKFIIDGLNLGTHESVDVMLDGSLVINEGELRFDNVELGLFEVAMRGEGTVKNGMLDLKVQSNKVDFRKMTQYFPQLKELALTGWASLSANITGPLSEPSICGSLSMGAASFTIASFQDMPYQLDRVDADFRYHAGQIYVEDLIMRQGNGSIRLAGVIGVDGQLDLETTIAQVDMARNIPGFQSYRIGGNMDFAGRISGHITNPVFTGELQAKNGVFFGRRVDRAVGQITLTSRNIQLDKLTIFQNGVPYFLAGTIGLRGVRWVDLGLSTVGGEVQEILAALRIDSDLTAKIDGTLHFSGPVWRLDVEGRVRLSQGQFMGQPFDVAEGKFVVTHDHVYVIDGLATYKNASVAFSGGGLRGGTLRLDVNATGWRVDDIRLVENKAELIQEAGSEPIALTGQAFVEGSLAEPRGFLEAMLSVPQRDAVKKVNLKLVSR